MKQKKYSELLGIPEGIACDFTSRVLTCTKNGVSLKRKIEDSRINVKLIEGKIELSSNRPDKRARTMINTYLAHIRNMFLGLDKKYSYKLEACNVHFPMTLKADKNLLLINNFLGEKTSRKAVILPNVDVQLNGAKITVSSHDKEAAGQTAANIEKATKVRNRDRRIFQDGIYITEKPGDNE